MFQKNVLTRLALFLFTTAITLTGCTSSLNNAPEELAASSTFNASTASREIELISASAFAQDYIKAVVFKRNFLIRVKNLGFQKTIHVRHKKTDGTWTDIPASYQKTTSAGDEIWSAATLEQFTISGMTSIYADEFALQYRVNQSTFWDNNNGQNYRLNKDDGVLLGNNISILQYSYKTEKTADAKKIRLNLDLRNIAYQKSVKIVYTTNNWQTSSTLNASFVTPYIPENSFGPKPNPNVWGVERWAAEIVLPLSFNGNCDWAVSYTVNGNTYWDNHFGSNYRVNCNY